MKSNKTSRMKLKSMQIISVTTIFLLLVTILTMSCACTTTDSKITAWTCAQKVVSDRLKSPSTAKFPAYSSSYVKDMGNNKYQIDAYVDSQNGFGAMIRTNFTVTLTLTEHGFKDYNVVFK